MFRQAALMALLVGLGIPAVWAHEYLIFRNNATRTTEVKDAPSIAVFNLGENDKAIPWSVRSGNRLASDYLRNGDEVTLSPPAPPIVPKVDAFLDAVQDDGTINEAVKEGTERMVLYYVYGKRAAALKIWNRIKAAAPAQSDKVKTHAAANDLVLP